MILRLRATATHVAGHRRIIEHGRQINSFSLPVLHVRALHEAIDPANHLVHFSETELRHHEAQVFRNVKQEIDYMLRLTREFFP